MFGEHYLHSIHIFSTQYLQSIYSVSTGSNLTMGTLLSFHRHDLDQVATFSEILASLKVGGNSLVTMFKFIRIYLCSNYLINKCPISP